MNKAVLQKPKKSVTEGKILNICIYIKICKVVGKYTDHLNT